MNPLELLNEVIKNKYRIRADDKENEIVITFYKDRSAKEEIKKVVINSPIKLYTSRIEEILDKQSTSVEKLRSEGRYNSTLRRYNYKGNEIIYAKSKPQLRKDFEIAVH